MNLPAKFYSEIFAQNPFKGYTLKHVDAWYQRLRHIQECVLPDIQMKSKVINLCSSPATKTVNFIPGRTTEMDVKDLLRHDITLTSGFRIPSAFVDKEHKHFFTCAKE